MDLTLDLAKALRHGSGVHLVGGGDETLELQADLARGQDRGGARLVCRRPSLRFDELLHRRVEARRPRSP